jgi:hypothetical protein
MGLTSAHIDRPLCTEGVVSLRSRSPLSAVVAALLLLFTLSPPGTAAAAPAAAGYRVGVGIGDITGEAADVDMLGYADPAQTSAGIASRQWARAFVIADAAGNHVAFVSTEIDFVTQAVQMEVLKRLKARYGDTYTDQNVVLTATHTHSGPGGFSEYTLWNLTTLGFEQKTFDAIVDGIMRAITAADANLAPGTVKIAEGTLAGANVNRSLQAFNADPRQGEISQRRRPADDRAAFRAGRQTRRAARLLRHPRHLDDQAQPPDQRRQQGLRRAPGRGRAVRRGLGAPWRLRGRVRADQRG